MLRSKSFYKQTFFALILLVLFLAADCRRHGKDKDGDKLFAWWLFSVNSCPVPLPEGFPCPSFPENNLFSWEKSELGRHLFYDKRLSRDRTMSCASCHLPERAFSDGKAVPTGIAAAGSQVHIRNAQHLANAGYHSRLTWANPNAKNLEDQQDGPLFGTGAPILELGLDDPASKASAVAALQAEVLYQEGFMRAFGSSEVTLEKVKMAIATFERGLISGNSIYDRYQKFGDTSQISAKAIAGASLFFGERAECFHCHGGFNYTDTTAHVGKTIQEFFYHNNALKAMATYQALPTNQQGLIAHTLRAEDLGRFRAPSLRNIGVTYPYMHDGSLACTVASDDFASCIANPGNVMDETKCTCAREALGKVIDHYSSGGSVTTYSGSGIVDTTMIRPFAITPSERTELVEFLMSLTDYAFLTNASFANPRPGDPSFGK